MENGLRRRRFRLRRPFFGKSGRSRRREKRGASLVPSGMRPRTGSHRRVAHLLALLTLLCTAVAACDGTTSPPTSKVSGAGSTSGSSLASTSPSPDVSSRPFVDACANARKITSAFPGPDDAVIGPLSYAGLRAFRASPVDEANWNGGYYYKSGAQLRPGVSVTVSIEGPAAAYTRIVTESGPTDGARSVTYQSCDRSAAMGSWWVGGFVLYGRHSACVPLLVSDPAGPAAHRAVVALGASDCS